MAKAFMVLGKTDHKGNFYQVFPLDQNSKWKIEFTKLFLLLLLLLFVVVWRTKGRNKATKDIKYSLDLWISQIPHLCQFMDIKFIYNLIITGWAENVRRTLQEAVQGPLVEWTKDRWNFELRKSLNRNTSRVHKPKVEGLHVSMTELWTHKLFRIINILKITRHHKHATTTAGTWVTADLRSIYL